MESLPEALWKKVYRRGCIFWGLACRNHLFSTLTLVGSVIRYKILCWGSYFFGNFKPLWFSNFQKSYCEVWCYSNSRFFVWDLFFLWEILGSCLYLHPWKTLQWKRRVLITGLPGKSHLGSCLYPWYSEMQWCALGWLLEFIMLGNPLVVQWLGLHASTAGGPGLIPGQGNKIPQARWCGQKKKKNHHGWPSVGVFSLQLISICLGKFSCINIFYNIFSLW